MSLGSKHNEMTDVYTLLMHLSIQTMQLILKQKILKTKIMNNIKPLYDSYFDAYKKNYNSENVKD